MNKLLSLALLTGLVACSNPQSHSAAKADQDESVEVPVGTTLAYSYEFTSQALPEGAAFFFSDYPASEDAAAKSPDRLKAIDETVAKFKANKGREPNVVEMGMLHIANGGYYLTCAYSELTSEIKGFFIAAINRSDDVDSNLTFTLGTKDTVVLEAHTTYEVSGDFSFYSNAPTGGFGVGGAPDAVHAGLSASSQPFGRTLDRGYWRTTMGGKLNVNPSHDSSYADLGSISNGIEMGEEHSSEFGLNETYIGRSTIEVTTDSSGLVYVNFRTHSGFESLSTWFVKSVKLTLTKVK